MAKTDAPTITPEQSTAARQAARAKKADAEKVRREKIKSAKEAVAKAKLPVDTNLSAEQRDRAAASAQEKPGLSGKALATWILEGQALAEQTEAAKTSAAAEKAEARTRQNITRSADPEAAELAKAAKALAPDVKSAFLPKDAREFLDLFKVMVDGQTLAVCRTDKNAPEDVAIKRADLRKLGVDGVKGEDVKDVRAALSAVGKGSRLWGRKLALMILAHDAAQKAAAKK